MKNIIDVNWLKENDYILFDATNNFMNHSEGFSIYSKGHIEGAYHIDLKNNLIGTVKAHGGRDPLPDNIYDFAKKLEEFGINNDTNIVVYDDSYFYACRFWWMCKYIGLKNVKVLNGGKKALIENGYKLTDAIPTKPEKNGSISVNLNKNLIADISDIKNAIKDSDTLIIDSRDKERYLGLVENIDNKSGHIPNAKNYPFSNVLSNGLFKNFSEIQQNFDGIEKYKNIIAYCGSGISANINIIAMDEVGITCKLYVGSWSDYISYEDSIIE